MRWRGRGAAVAATVLVGLMTAGCTGDATPTGPTGTHSPSASADAPSATPTASPAPDVSVPPARPDAMATPSADGAAAAASYFLQLYPYAYASGDLSEWDSMSDPACGFCTNVRSNVTRLQETGHRDDESTVTVVSQSAAEIVAGESYSALVVVDQTPSRELAPDGTVVSSDEGGRFEMTFALSWKDGWRVAEVDVARVS
ncbi:DUF6318 family protein [Cellulomonas sp. NPDC057328]|uniref:DUF6318 family protein n=1 Tax=Cellulomonas sp. NPDC057328 TaxID=3346101 RepID=UPI0036458D03